MFRKTKIILSFCLLGTVLLESSDQTSVTGPNARLIFAPRQLTSQTAFALMGEIGEKTARVNGTLGYQIGSCQRLKLSVDQLSQKLTYDFLHGHKDVWVKQIAGGASYKYFLDDECFDSFDAGGWYSNANNQKLSPIEIRGDATSQTFEQRIAGGDAWHIYMGTTLFPWSGATLGLAAVYDHVHYKRKINQNENLSGAGLTVDFNQKIFQSVDFSLKSDWFQPYQHVGGVVNWVYPSCYGDLVIGFYGDYTKGQKGLPNNTSFGIQMNLAFGEGAYASPFYRQCCLRDRSRPKQDLYDWMADPAVMMPIVLAVVDQCSPPQAFLLPNVNVDLGAYAIPTAHAFSYGSCAKISYSAKGLPPGSFIDEDSGIIFGSNLGLFSLPFVVTVKGACACGSATSTFLLTYENL